MAIELNGKTATQEQIDALGAELSAGKLVGSAAAQIGDMARLDPNMGSTLPQFVTQRGRALANEDRCRVVIIGSSTPRGTGAGTGANFRDGATAKAFPTVLARALNSMGYRSHAMNFMGTGNYFSDTLTMDPRITYEAGWVDGVTSVGGKSFYNNSTAGKHSFNPGAGLVFDNYTVNYTRSPGHETQVDIFVDGVLSQTVSADATSALGQASFTVPRANHTISVAKRAANSLALYHLGIECWDSQNQAIEIHNYAAGSSDASDWIDEFNPRRNLSVLKTKKFDAAIVWLGINAMQNGVSLSSWLADYQTLITGLKSVGTDVILCVPPQFKTSIVDAVTQETWWQATRSLAAANGLPVAIDFSKRLPPFANVLSRGLFASDPSHIKAPLHADIGTALARVLSGF